MGRVAVYASALVWLGCAPPNAMVEHPPSGRASLEPRVRAAPVHASSPLLGGTLAISADANAAVVADPDRDRVSIVDLERMEVLAQHDVGPRAEPGRIAIAGRIAYVVLRRGGAIASFDLTTSRALARVPVCPAPRGIAHDPALDELWIACAGGELVRLDASGATLSVMRLPPDLRDVVLDDESILVSRFRSADVLVVDRLTTLVRTVELPAFDLLAAQPEFNPMFEPSVAWRMVGKPSGGAYLAHQRAATFPIDDPPIPRPAEPSERRLSYGVLATAQPAPLCPTSLVHAAVTTLDGRGSASLPPGFPRGALPIDLAIDPRGRFGLMVFAGEDVGSVFRFPLETIESAVPSTAGHGCVDERALREVGLLAPLSFRDPIAVAWVSDERIAVQYASPPSVVVTSVPVPTYEHFVVLGETLPDADARRSFHQSTVRGVACASCHPEGADDGRVWDFGDRGRRRTQSLGGPLLASAPFHWNGEHRDLASLLDDVLVERMGGTPLGPSAVEALGAWLDALPAPGPTAALDRESIARGSALFHDPEVACARCHVDGDDTDARNHDVGTGGLFQTPALRGLVYRAPYFHDGCARDLEARFDDCHTPEHGDIDGLDASARRDLVAYLSSL
jgi:hypothetical protein